MSRRVLMWLVTLVLVLPVLICLMLGMATLLDALQDTAGARAIRYVALATGMLWFTTVVAAVVWLAVDRLSRDERERPPPPPPPPPPHADLE